MHGWLGGRRQNKDNTMGKTANIPAVPVLRRVEDHPKVKAARERHLEAGRKFDQVNADAATARAMAKERRQALMQLQARVSMGDEKQAALDGALKELQAIEARATVYGDFEAAKEEFTTPYRDAYCAAYVEAAEELEAAYREAIEARLAFVRENVDAIAQAAAEVLDMARKIESSNNNARGRGIEKGQIRPALKPGDIGTLERIVYALKPYASN